MRGACIDIGSNTTRLLVAEQFDGRLSEIHQERAFTHVGRGRHVDGTIDGAKIREVATVVTQQLQAARAAGAESVRVVATAAIRSAPNRAELVSTIRTDCGVEVDILSDEEEARLAFIGLARTLGHRPHGELGVVDVGGGSSELVVGSAPDQITWWASFALGSGELARRCLLSDPPAVEELDDARRQAADAFEGVEVPRPAEAAAVGGSAASLGRLAGPLLDQAAFARAIGLLVSRPAAEVAGRFGLDVERVRLLPAGLVILEAAGERFGLPLTVGRGGVREGVLLESARA